MVSSNTTIAVKPVTKRTRPITKTATASAKIIQLTKTTQNKAPIVTQPHKLTAAVTTTPGIISTTTAKL